MAAICLVLLPNLARFGPRHNSNYINTDQVLCLARTRLAIADLVARYSKLGSRRRDIVSPLISL